MDERGLNRQGFLKILRLAQTFNECLDRSDVFDAFFLQPIWVPPDGNAETTSLRMSK